MRILFSAKYTFLTIKIITQLSQMATMNKLIIKLSSTYLLNPVVVFRDSVIFSLQCAHAARHFIFPLTVNNSKLSKAYFTIPGVDGVAIRYSY